MGIEIDLPGMHEKLTAMYRDWEQAGARVDMARSTLLGAEQDALLKEVRFKAAAEVVYGANATWEYSEEGGLRFTVKEPPA